MFLDTCVGVVLQQLGVGLQDTLDLAGARPRQLLGLPPLKLAPGCPADLVLFDFQPGQGFHVRETILAGRRG